MQRRSLIKGAFAGFLAVALQHHAHALLGRGEALEDVGGGALQADGRGVDEPVVLELFIVEGGQGLIVRLVDAADRHIAGLVELLDASQQAGRLDLDGHIAVLQHPFDGDVFPVLVDVGGVGDLGQAQLLRHLGAHLGGVAVDGLPAAHDHVVLLHADGVHGGGQDLRGGVGVGAAELPGGDRKSTRLNSSHP